MPLFHSLKLAARAIRWEGLSSRYSLEWPISTESSFTELLTRVRSGDDRAAEVLVRDYEGAIRRVVRVRLTDPKLRRQFDSIDVCQSVMADFFVRAALGQFELESAQQLLNLLATMARNKLLNYVAMQQAQQRDVRRVEATGVEEFAVAAAESTPSQIVANRELLARFRDKLTESERYLADQRAQGRPWNDLAKELEETPDAVRVRFGRAIDRVSKELGLDSLVG